MVSKSARGCVLCAKKFALLGLLVGVSAKKFALRTKNGPKLAFYGVLGELFRGNAAAGAVLGELFRGAPALRALLIGQTCPARQTGPAGQTCPSELVLVPRARQALGAHGGD